MVHGLLRLWLVVALVGVGEAQAAGRKGKQPVVLEVTASLRGAEVHVDGHKVGEAPYKSRSLAPGAHKVTVKKLGHLEYSENIEIRAGHLTSIFADLLPFAGVLAVKSEVKGAEVLVDGVSVGNAPLTTEIKIGAHVITVRAAGKKDFTQELRAEPGQTYPVDARFSGKAPNVALLPLEGPGGAGDELALEPMTGGAGSPELSLEAPPPLSPLGTDLTALPPMEALPTASATMSRPSPWYKKWWVWTAAGVAVSGGVAAFVLMRGGDEAKTVKPDAEWAIPF